MADITLLSAKKLHEAIERKDEKRSKLLKEVIAAGHGDKRHSEMRELAESGDDLAKRYIAANDDWQAAVDELHYRQRYSGEDKPIKRRFL